MADGGEPSHDHGLSGPNATPRAAASPLPPSPPMPVAFIGHGAPTLAVDADRGAPLAKLASSFPEPRAILAVSAHWETRAPTLGAVTPRPIAYDFLGFPEALYQIRYPAPCAPELGRRVENLLRPWNPSRAAERALDHGVWVPLVHMYPSAGVPVLQLSLPSRLSGADLVRIGAALAPLRTEGVFLFGSGSLTHNLRLARHDDPAPPPAWATEFDAWCADALTRWDLDALADYRRRSPALHVAHPTEEHFLPLLIATGAASTSGRPEVTFPVDGFEHRSLSRRTVLMR